MLSGDESLNYTLIYTLSDKKLNDNIRHVRDLYKANYAYPLKYGVLTKISCNFRNYENLPKTSNWLSFLIEGIH